MLMRSGIGPQGHLKHHGIGVVADVSGVGENLTDHPHLAVAAHMKPQGRLPRHQRRHIFLGVRYSSNFAQCDRGDMLIMPVNRSGWHPLGRSIAALNVCVNRSYSQGTVRLRSASPLDEPEIDLNLASDARDLARLVDGFKRLYRIIDFKRIGEIAQSVEKRFLNHFLAQRSILADAIKAESVKRL